MGETPWPSDFPGELAGDFWATSGRLLGDFQAGDLGVEGDKASRGFQAAL